MAAPASLWEQRTLDCPKFAGLLERCGFEGDGVREHVLTGDRQGEADYKTIQGEYEDLWKRYLAVSLVKGALAMNGADHGLIRALTASESSLGALCQCKEFSSDGGPAQVTAACESLLARLLPLSRLLFPSPNSIGGVNCCQDVISQVRSALRGIDEQQRQARSSCTRTVVILADASLHLADVTEQAARLTQAVAPLAHSYVETFAQYIGAVVESLDLKLRIIERETMLSALSADPGPDYHHRASRAAQGMVAELEAATQQAEANFLLLRQLGPSLESTARQYQQVVSQLALVREDLASLLQ